MKKKVIIFLAICLAIGGLLLLRDKYVEGDGESGGTLPGAMEVYPTVMVDGELYAWRGGREGQRELCEEDIYYGELIYVVAAAPRSDREFVAAFDASGQIYTQRNISDEVYLLLTTDWMTNRLIVFEKVSETPTPSPEPQKAETLSISQVEGLEVVVQEGSVTSKKLSVEVTCDIDAVYTFNAGDWWIQRNDSGNWKEPEVLNETYPIDDWARDVSPGWPDGDEYWWDQRYGEQPPGEYRIIVRLYSANDSIYLAAPFEIPE